MFIKLQRSILSPCFLMSVSSDVAPRHPITDPLREQTTVDLRQEKPLAPEHISLQLNSKYSWYDMGACRTWIISSPGRRSLTWTRGSRSFPGRRRRRPSAARCLWTSRLDTSPSPDTSPLSSAPARRPSGACRRTEPDICGGWQEQESSDQRRMLEIK